MAPPATATARRAPATAHPLPTPGDRPADQRPRRPPLRVFEPGPKRRAERRRFRRSTLWVSAGIVVASLLAVVVADGMVAQHQIALSRTEAQLASATATEKALQTRNAEMAAPPLIVHQAESQGLVAPSQVIDLPQVPLDVPLPPPSLVPAAPASAPGPTAGSAGASSPTSTTSTGQ